MEHIMIIYMNWNLDIPKVIHLYWGGLKLIYLRYLTVKTLLKYNPGWEIKLWYPTRPFTGESWEHPLCWEKWKEELCKDYLQELMALPITLCPVDFEALGFAPNAAEVQKADYIRLNVMHLYGGVWSDMDIIYFAPLENLKVNTPANKNIETYVCIADYGHSTGFHLSRKGSRFFKEMFDLYKTEYDPNSYQICGPDMFNKYHRYVESIPNAINLDMDVVYAHNCFILHEVFDGSAPRFTDGSIGYHWYAGHPIWFKFYNDTEGGEKNLTDNIIGNLIKNAV